VQLKQTVEYKPFFVENLQKGPIGERRHSLITGKGKHSLIAFSKKGAGVHR
jgi:hypothetical protein